MASPANHKSNTNHQVIAFPARTPLVGGRQILFMFSVRQVVDVLRQVDLRPGTDGGHTVGLADWRGSMVPVLELEKSLGLRVTASGMPQRNIVVRSVAPAPNGEARDLYAVCRVGAAARQFQLPMECQPVAPPRNLPGVDLIDGMYTMAEHLFIVVNIAKMVSGQTVTMPEEAMNGF